MITKLSNLTLALFNPAKYNIQKFPERNPYDITKLSNNFRSLHILANRDGEADITLPLGYVGEVGHFFELPSIDKINYSTLKF